jgi:tight adherence protein B
MTLPIVAFLCMMLVTFGILIFAMRPTSEQKALDKRLTHIKTAAGGTADIEGGLLRATPDSGKFAWLESIAEHFKLSDKLQTLLIQSNTTMSLGKLLFLSAACGCIAFGLLYVFTSALIVAGPAGAAATFMPVFFLRIKRKRRIAAFNAGLADSIDMMARSLRAGHSVVAAIGIVAEQAVEPVNTEFNEVFKKQNYGLPLREALMQLLDRVPSQDLRVLVTGMLVQKETGGNLAEILDRITFVIRERLRIQGEIRTHTAQGRLTGWILCLLPIVMLFLIDWVNPGYSKVLFDEPTGQKLLGLGVVLLIVGGLIIRQIIHGIEV